MPELFPANPSNRMVFELRPGLSYIYEAATHAWIRVAGGQIFPLATPISNGMMAASDLHKINRVIVPAPTSTIKGENCTGRFISGRINLYSTDDFLRITGEPLIKNAGIGGAYQFRITKNTGGFDFTIDKNALVQELLARGQINIVGKRGAKGQKGHKGKAGGPLATGPKGPKGNSGASPPCTVTISQDTVPTEISKSLNKAIVALSVSQTSETTYALVAKRGIVGNPDAAPTSANVNCGDKSTWVMAVGNVSGLAQQVYYIDLAGIISLVQEKFASELQRIKAGHESVVKFWLEKMSRLFYQQKAAMCCAVTRCEKTNAEINRGATGIFDSTTTTPAPLPLSAHFPLHLASHPTPKTLGMPHKTMQLTIDGAINIGTIKQAATIDLPTGRYTISIAKCCIKTGDEFVANVHVSYNQDNKPQQTQFMKPGKYASKFMAEHAYSNLTIEINHSGGPVQAYLASSLMQPTDGAVVLNFLKHGDTPPTITPAQSFVCTLSQEKLASYEVAWDTNKCFGLVMNVIGQDYIILRRLAPGNDCDDQFSLAWPTLDQKTFVHLSETSEYNFKVDKALNEIVVQNLRLNLYINEKGVDAAAQIGTVLFPVVK